MMMMMNKNKKKIQLSEDALLYTTTGIIEAKNLNPDHHKIQSAIDEENIYRVVGISYSYTPIKSFALIVKQLPETYLYEGTKIFVKNQIDEKIHDIQIKDFSPSEHLLPLLVSGHPEIEIPHIITHGVLLSTAELIVKDDAKSSLVSDLDQWSRPSIENLFLILTRQFGVRMIGPNYRKKLYRASLRHGIFLFDENGGPIRLESSYTSSEDHRILWISNPEVMESTTKRLMTLELELVDNEDPDGDEKEREEEGGRKNKKYKYDDHLSLGRDMIMVGVNLISLV